MYYDVYVCTYVTYILKIISLFINFYKIKGYDIYNYIYGYFCFRTSQELIKIITFSVELWFSKLLTTKILIQIYCYLEF